jgi:hypothetical protein
MGGKKPKAEPEEAANPHDSEEAEASGIKSAADFTILRDDLNLAARQFNTLWLGFMSLCAYLFITVWTVTPKTLFLAAPVKLPIFNVDLPLLVFFRITPLILLTCHIFLVLLAKGVEGKVQMESRKTAKGFSKFATCQCRKTNPGRANAGAG